MNAHVNLSGESFVVSQLECEEHNLDGSRLNYTFSAMTVYRDPGNEDIRFTYPVRAMCNALVRAAYPIAVQPARCSKLRIYIDFTQKTGRLPAKMSPTPGVSRRLPDQQAWL